MSRETSMLVDALRTTQARISLLACKLLDGTATTEEQRQVVDKLEELMDLLQSHAADIDAGIVPASRHLLLTERHSA
jgi:hypothetical protein